MNKTVCFIVALFVTMAQAVAQTHSVTKGWNLIANDTTGNVDSSTLPTTLVTVWTWNSEKNVWNFYTPSKSAADLTSYALTKGYDVLSTIKPGEGFWVNSSHHMATSLTLTATSPPSAQDDLMQTGWSLEGNNTGVSIDPSVMFGDPTIAPLIKTVWTWDNERSIWNFYAPSMSAADLASYTFVKGYDVLSEIKPGEGYWVNVSTCTEPQVWIASAKACVYPIGTQATGISQLPADGTCTITTGTALSQACKAYIAKGTITLEKTNVVVNGHPTVWMVFNNPVGRGTLVLVDASNLASLVPLSTIELASSLVWGIGNPTGININLNTATAGVYKNLQVLWNAVSSTFTTVCYRNCNLL